jgi:hypothetical protein
MENLFLNLKKIKTLLINKKKYQNLKYIEFQY